jgi:hypothetical protein
LYVATPSGAAVRRHIEAGAFAWADTPRQGNRRPAGVVWGADNGCFTLGDRWDADEWWNWLETRAGEARTCLYAAAPDVVGDAAATLVRSAPWLPRIRALGYPAALVAQDGLTVSTCPWDIFDVLFVGGSTDWKLGPVARDLVSEANRRGVWVHMGRVNSQRRWRYAEAIGCDSVDGTYLAFGPDVNLPKLLTWVNAPSLFAGAPEKEKPL